MAKIKSPRTEIQEQEAYKHRLALRLLLIDKLFLALLILIIGFFVNRSLELYKNSLQKDLEKFKAEQTRLSDQSRFQQTQETSLREQSYKKELEQFKAEQNKEAALKQQANERELENLKQQQLRYTETFRVLLETQSQLSARKVIAYERTWNSFGELYNFVSHVGMDISGYVVQEQRKNLVNAAHTFDSVFNREKLFLDESLVQELKGIPTLLSIAAEERQGQAPLFMNTYRSMTEIEKIFREKMEKDLKKISKSDNN